MLIYFSDVVLATAGRKQLWWLVIWGGGGVRHLADSDECSTQTIERSHKRSRQALSLCEVQNPHKYSWSSWRCWLCGTSTK